MSVRRLIKIAITPETAVHDEARFIRCILDAGWDYIHLRRPTASMTEMRRLIESIPQQYHSQLKLHGHFELTHEFNLGGLHLNHRCPMPPALYKGNISRSCHSLQEIASSENCEYLTLSPIYDSISKHGYKAAFTDEQLKNIPKDKNVIALGGITPERINDLKQYPFAGFAMLGYLFENADLQDLKSKLRIIDKSL